MADEMERGEATAVEFRQLDGMRVAIRPERVDAVQELERGCVLVTNNDTYRVDHPYVETVAVLWPGVGR